MFHSLLSINGNKRRLRWSEKRWKIASAIRFRFDVTFAQQEVEAKTKKKKNEENFSGIGENFLINFISLHIKFQLI